MIFPLWSILPFICMLASIAIVPLVFGSWWDKNSNKLLLSLAVSIPVLTVVLPNASNLLIESLTDYFSFIVLLGALFIISGGIYIKGQFSGTPLVNTGFLAVGAILANLIGTTGASMLLIRPYLRANHARQRTAHLAVFFIFIVSNTAGLLTPLGDPPLFLGFLRGVPFQWTLSLFPVWAAVVGILLLVFNLYDQYVFVREDVETPGALVEDVQSRRKIHIQGAHNFLFLLGVMGAAIASGHYGWPRNSGIDHDRHGLAVVVFHVTICASVESLSLPPDPGGRRRVLGNFCHDDSRFGDFGTQCAIFKPPAALAVLLDVGHSFKFPGQRANLLDVLCDGVRHRRNDGRESGGFVAHAIGDFASSSRIVRLGLYGRQHLHRQRPKLHGEEHCGACRREDAFLRRVHGVFGNDPDSDLSGRDGRLFPLIRACYSHGRRVYE